MRKTSGYLSSLQNVPHIAFVLLLSKRFVTGHIYLTATRYYSPCSRYLFDPRVLVSVQFILFYLSFAHRKTRLSFYP